jgi:epoxyqueuosine reductase
MKELIGSEIKSFVSLSAFNRSQERDCKYFDEPLIGFARAQDPIFAKYKEIIGEFYLSPTEWLESESGSGSFMDGTVISWILPINETALASNRAETAFPSREWAHVKVYGEKFNRLLMIHIGDLLTKAGFRSVAPSLSKKWRTIYSEKAGRASNWSERHAAYAAGLGTFSLNDGLITARGIAHRCGSIITDLVLEPTARPYQGIKDYCLYYNSGKCGACIKRCPVGAISFDGHNKDICFDYQGTEDTQDMKNVIKFHGLSTVEVEYSRSSCGLCQTGVPCEQRIPAVNK